MNASPDRKKLLLFSAVIFIFLYFFCKPFFAAVPDSTAVSARSKGGAEAPTDGESFLSVTPQASPGTLTASPERIHWWYNEENRTYYLFLPAFTDLERLTARLNGASPIAIDGKTVESGEFSLSPGRHTVTLPGAKEDLLLVVLRSSNLPSLYLSTSSGSLDALKADKEHAESGELTMLDPDGRLIYSGDLEFIKGHGNATWTETDKKAWQLKLQDKADLAASGAARRWLLVPNCFDDSLLRNYLSYHAATEIGLSFTPQSTFVDCYVNGEYQGNYLLCEKVEVDEQRVDIADLARETERMNQEVPSETFESYANGNNGDPYTSKGFLIPQNPADITGGYLLEMDMLGRYQEEPSGFVTARGRSVVIKSPACASKEQVNYISTLYEETEAAVFAADGRNPDTGRHFSEYLDVESFAKKYIMEELSKNVDASLSSQYFYKPSDAADTRFLAGPVWDYDSAWGYGGTRSVYSYGGIKRDVELYNPETFYANRAIDNATLWYGLYNQPLFYNAVCQIYQNEVLPVMEDALEEQVPLWAQTLADSAVMNNCRWNVNADGSEEETRENYFERVDSMLRFARKRTAFLAESWLPEPSE